MLGTTEVIVVVGVVLILFGARAIPKFARSVGQAKREFEKGVKEGEDESKQPESIQPPPKDSDQTKQ